MNNVELSAGDGEGAISFKRLITVISRAIVAGSGRWTWIKGQGWWGGGGGE